MFFELVRSSGDLQSLAVTAVAIITAFVVGIGFHEFSHVFVAYLLGDTTGRDLGRLTLNPIKHLDPFGSMMLLLVGFGWGKPAPVNPYRLKTGPTTGWSLVAIAGPLSNFLMAAALASLLRLDPFRSALISPGGVLSGWNFFLAQVIEATVIINVLLGVFNLLPIPPLDGYRVALRLLPRELAASYQRVEQYGPFILMLLFAVPFFTGSRVNPLNGVIGPLRETITRYLLGG
ncbi:MAG TPA: site-2 protease family protein [Bryobacteraceae bacterium]|nr:site-2 protease family protein [Bryobacteraceae bacterium]